MNRPRVLFGDDLGGSDNAALRAGIERFSTGAITVLSVLAGFALLRRGRPVSIASGPLRPGPVLLLDLHRFFWLRPRAGTDCGVELESAIRFIIDGYEMQPFAVVEEHLCGRPYRFLHNPAVLEILPLAASAVRPGGAVTLDLRSGEIEVFEILPHPRVGPAGHAPARSVEEVARRSVPGLRDRWTDGSLRAASRCRVEGLVSRSLGVVRALAPMPNLTSLAYRSAVLSFDRGENQQHCYGKSGRPEEARAIALYEALERFQIALPSRQADLVYDSYRHLRRQAIDPEALLYGALPDAGESARTPYGDDVPMYWTWAEHPVRAERVLVPAQEVWFGGGRSPRENLFIQSTTNGCAVGGTAEEAAMFGLLEAIERDAFLTTWYLRRRCEGIDPESVDDARFHILRQRWPALFPGYRVRLLDLTSDLRVPTVAAVAVREPGRRGPRMFHAAACRLSASQACATALADLTAFDPRWMRQRRERAAAAELARAGSVREPDDHAAVYALDEAFERVAFLALDAPAEARASEIDARALVSLGERNNLKQIIGRITEQAEKVGATVVFKDVTHPWVGERGLRCVKAITPGLFPMWFGQHNRRVAVTPRLERLARRFTDRGALTLEDLNLDIHPFS